MTAGHDFAFSLFATGRIEGVGRQVDDSHHLRLRQIKQSPIAIQCVVHIVCKDTK